MQKILFMLILFVSVTAFQQIKSCYWVQQSSIDQISDYLRFLQQGTCHYMIKKTISSINKKNQNLQEFTVYLNSIKSTPYSPLAFSCKIQQSTQNNSCTQIGNQIGLQLPQSQGNSSITYKYDSQNKELEITFNKIDKKNVGQKFRSFKKIRVLQVDLLHQAKIASQTSYYLKFSTRQWQVILFPISYFFLTIFTALQPVLQTYSYLQISLMLKIIMQSIDYLELISIQGQIGSFNLVKYLILCLISFATIGIWIKFLISYIQFGTFRTKEKQNGNMGNPSILLLQQSISPSLQQQNSSSVDQKINMLKQIKQNIALFFNQSTIVDRVFWVLIVLIYSILNSYLYQIIGMLFDSFFLILLPVFLTLKSVNQTTQFQQIIVNQPKKQSRRQMLLPKIKIACFFGTFILKSVKYFSFDLIRVFVQLIVILLCLSAILTAISIIVCPKIGKKVRIYGQKNFRTLKNLQRLLKYSKIVQFLIKRVFFINTRQNQNKQQIVCSICLQRVHPEIQSSQSQLAQCVQTECGHIFHINCFSKWTANKMICPIDRYNLNSEMVCQVLSYNGK